LRPNRDAQNSRPPGTHDQLSLVQPRHQRNLASRFDLHRLADSRLVALQLAIPSILLACQGGAGIMTEIDFAYFNFEHGGLIDGRDHFYSSGRGYDFGGLIRVAGSGGRWPHVLVLGEGDRYEMAGGEGMWEAAAAMRDAGGPTVCAAGVRTARRGLYAPVIFVDPQAMVIRRFYYHRRRQCSASAVFPVSPGPITTASRHEPWPEASAASLPRTSAASARSTKWTGRGGSCRGMPGSEPAPI
jgi:hypothetical protein